MPAVRVLLFAAHREAAGRSAVELALPEGATVGDLRRALGEAVPALAKEPLPTVVAVDGEFCGDGAPLRRGAKVAVFPPVAGG
jgi:molybdopterin converting factor subunit 1